MTFYISKISAQIHHGFHLINEASRCAIPHTFDSATKKVLGIAIVYFTAAYWDTSYYTIAFSPLALGTAYSILIYRAFPQFITEKKVNEMRCRIYQSGDHTFCDAVIESGEVVSSTYFKKPKELSRDQYFENLRNDHPVLIKKEGGKAMFTLPIPAFAEWQKPPLDQWARWGNVQAFRLLKFKNKNYWHYDLTDGHGVCQEKSKRFGSDDVLEFKIGCSLLFPYSVGFCKYRNEYYHNFDCINILCSFEFDQVHDQELLGMSIEIYKTFFYRVAVGIRLLNSGIAPKVLNFEVPHSFLESLQDMQYCFLGTRKTSGVPQFFAKPFAKWKYKNSKVLLFKKDGELFFRVEKPGKRSVQGAGFDSLPKEITESFRGAVSEALPLLLHDSPFFSTEFKGGHVHLYKNGANALVLTGVNEHEPIQYFENFDLKTSEQTREISKDIFEWGKNRNIISKEFLVKRIDFSRGNFPILHFEPISFPSKIDPRVKISPFYCAITLVNHGSSSKEGGAFWEYGHAMLIIEMVGEKGEYQMKAAHLSKNFGEDLYDIPEKKYSKYKKNHRSPCWKVPVFTMNRMLDSIQKGKKDHFAITGSSIYNLHSLLYEYENCIEFCLGKFAMLGIFFRTSKTVLFRQVVAVIDYTFAPEEFSGNPYPKKAIDLALIEKGHTDNEGV